MKFQDLRLAEPILRAVTAEGYTDPTPIQQKAIPHVLSGRDLLGCAQTGTGKTAAFALPILHLLSQHQPAAAHAAPAHAPASSHTHRGDSRHHGRAPGPRHAPGRPIRSLILSPTRELASQIGDSFKAYGRNTHLRYTTVYGGVGQGAQTQAIQQGVDILVATPGRLLDLMNQGYIDLSKVEIFVLDEADRMLDMGFIHDIRKVVAKLPAKRQTLFFSATMPGDIRHLADTILRDPISVHVTPESPTVEKIEQSVYFVEKRNKPDLLIHLLQKVGYTRALVFTRTKHGADRVSKQLHHAGIRSEAIHGNKSQGARQRALGNFKSGKIPVLIASDIAARGIDIDEISHVINFDLPNVPETYIHRIGRTARAGASGAAISFCDHEERSFLRDIERLTRIPIAVVKEHPVYPPRQHEPREAPRPQGSLAGHGHRAPRHPSPSQPHAPSQGQQRQGQGAGHPHTPSRGPGSTARPTFRGGGHRSGR